MTDDESYDGANSQINVLMTLFKIFAEEDERNRAIETLHIRETQGFHRKLEVCCLPGFSSRKGASKKLASAVTENLTNRARLKAIQGVGLTNQQQTVSLQ